MQFMIAKVSSFGLFYRDGLRSPKPTIVLLNGIPLSRASSTIFFQTINRYLRLIDLACDSWFTSDLSIQL